MISVGIDVSKEKSMVCIFKPYGEPVEYVEIFYNRQRLHESNDYLTPEEYYVRAAA